MVPFLATPIPFELKFEINGTSLSLFSVEVPTCSFPHQHTMNIDVPDILRALGVDERASDTGGKVVQGECETVRARKDKRVFLSALSPPTL